MSEPGVTSLIYTLDNPLQAIKDDEKKFYELVQSQLSVLLRPYQLRGKLSLPRLAEARFYWMADLERTVPTVARNGLRQA